MKNYSDIFKSYSQGNIQFYYLGKNITFPSDLSLDIYDFHLVTGDIPWTVLSYTLYGTIDYWWVLSSLNRTQDFYAKDGKYIVYIKKDELTKLLKSIS